MTLNLDEMLARTRLERGQLVAWIEEGWIAPSRENDDFVFDEIDAARVNFICELVRDMMIGEEAIPVVLSLVDQINALRTTLKQVLIAAEELPDPARARLVTILKDIDSN
jgi:chaperone modulatory protein CbpM